MSTGYHLMPTNQPHIAGDGYTKAVAALFRVASWVREEDSRLYELVCETNRLGAAEQERVAEACRLLSINAVSDNNQPLTLIREPENEQVMYMTSGGEPGRSAKRLVARAFCRLVIEEMNKQDFDVNLHIV